MEFLCRLHRSSCSHSIALPRGCLPTATRSGNHFAPKAYGSSSSRHEKLDAPALVSSIRDEWNRHQGGAIHSRDTWGMATAPGVLATVCRRRFSPPPKYREKSAKIPDDASKMCKMFKRMCSKLEVYARYRDRWDLRAGSYTRCSARESRLDSLACSAANRDGRNRTTRRAYTLCRARWAAKLSTLQDLVSYLRHIESWRRGQTKRILWIVPNFRAVNAGESCLRSR